MAFYKLLSIMDEHIELILLEIKKINKKTQILTGHIPKCKQERDRLKLIVMAAINFSYMASLIADVKKQAVTIKKSLMNY